MQAKENNINNDQITKITPEHLSVLKEPNNPQWQMGFLQDLVAWGLIHYRPRAFTKPATFLRTAEGDQVLVTLLLNKAAEKPDYLTVYARDEMPDNLLTIASEHLSQPAYLVVYSEALENEARRVARALAYGLDNITSDTYYTAIDEANTMFIVGTDH